MMSEYYSKEDLIQVLQSHLMPEQINLVNFDEVVEDGEIYDGIIEGVNNPYIYEIPVPTAYNITVFVHPMICTEIYFDAWTGKEVYMGRKEGEIW